jgi:TatD DNase family protein
MLIDSHCHLPPLRKKDKAKQLVEDATAEGVAKLINIGTSLKDSKDAVETASSFDEVWSSVGVYPHENLDDSNDKIKKELQVLIENNDKIVAVGECGVDISEWREGRPIEDQLVLFETQIELALDNNLPVIIHNRNADELILKTLEKYRNENLTGVSHCFSSNWEFARRLLDLNFYVSFSGMITYPSREDLLETVRNVPNDRFLVETDAPYLPPEGMRGQKNEPKYVKIVAEKVAQTKKESFSKICEFSFGNTCALFGFCARK